MPQVTIHDFRITDTVLAQSDPEAGDVIFLGPGGDAAFPFVIWRRISGPGGTYLDAAEVVSPDGEPLLVSERKFELEGESITQDIVDEFRDVAFPAPGAYTLRYYVYDDHLGDIPFQVLRQDPPYGAVVPGPVDAALAKSTIAWVAVPQPGGREITKPVWYGYEEGRVYVLIGPQEQTVPGLDRSSHVRLIVRSKDTQSRVGEVECATQVLVKDAEWERIARGVMLGRRLNLHDGDKAVERWRQTCEIVQLTLMPSAPRTG